jgi:hypothetical protein
MNFKTIEVPSADFLFENIARKKAQDIISSHLYLGAFSNPYSGANERIEQEIFQSFSTLIQAGDKIVFVIMIITRIVNLKNEHQDNRNKLDVKKQNHDHYKSNYESTTDSLNEMQYYLYGLLSTYTGYNLDSNTFSDNEVSALNNKIDTILSKLNEIELGQEIIFDSIDELKNDFQSLKTDFPLGKKRWYQRVSGVVVSYLGTKGADEIFDALKPLLKELIHNAPELIKLLSS